MSTIADVFKSNLMFLILLLYFPKIVKSANIDYFSAVRLLYWHRLCEGHNWVNICWTKITFKSWWPVYFIVVNLLNLSLLSAYAVDFSFWKRVNICQNSQISRTLYIKFKSQKTWQHKKKCLLNFKRREENTNINWNQLFAFHLAQETLINFNFNQNGKYLFTEKVFIRVTYSLAYISNIVIIFQSVHQTLFNISDDM